MDSSVFCLRRVSVSNREAGMNFPEGSGDEQSPEELEVVFGLTWALMDVILGVRPTGRGGMAAKLRNYRRYLIGLEDELAECLRQAEDHLWHHAKAPSATYHVYNRLCLWIDEVHDRMEWYDNIQKTYTRTGRVPKRTAPDGGVVRHVHKRDDSLGDSRLPGFDVSDSVGRAEGDDVGTDDHRPDVLAY